MKWRAIMFWCWRLAESDEYMILNLPFFSFRIWSGYELRYTGMVLYGWSVALGWKNRKAWFYKPGAVPEYRWVWDDVEEYPKATIELLFGVRVPHSTTTVLVAAMAESERVRRLLRDVDARHAT